MVIVAMNFTEGAKESRSAHFDRSSFQADTLVLDY